MKEEAHYIHQPEDEASIGRRRLSLQLMEDKAAKQLPPELRATWEAVWNWMQQSEVQISLEEELEGEFVYYLSAHQLSPSPWLKELDQAVPNSREVLTKAFAIAEKILHSGGNGANATQFGDSFN